MKYLKFLLPAVVGCVLPASAVFAADIYQSGSVPAGNTWNNSDFWGGNPVVPENSYITAPFGASEVAFSVNGVSWQTSGNMRDSEGSSIFNGGALVINPGTRLLSKALGGATSTANIVLNGGFIHSAANAAGSATLDGTISFGDGITLGAIGLIANPNFTFNVASTIIGGPGVTLQLVMNGADRTNFLNVIGDISGFAGTFYVSTADGGVAYGSAFSITSSAPLATLQLAVDSPNFLFNVANDITFGSLLLGDTALGAGTYTVADLDVFAPGKFFGDGSITVVPEPATTALMSVALAAGAVALRRRRS